jgi:hypothetical protein
MNSAVQRHQCGANALPLSALSAVSAKGGLPIQPVTPTYGGMITLVRGLDTVQITSLLWEALQVYAKQAGWEPAGTIGVQDRCRHNIYGPGQIVTRRDADDLAAALAQVVNSEKGDSGDLDLSSVVALVNFLRRGPFEIR